MPYISNQDVRARLNESVDKLLKDVEHVGDLNYIVTRLLHQYIIREYLSYSTVNAVIGVLECAKLELYRQVAAPYEDGKKRTNGAVSILDGL